MDAPVEVRFEIIHYVLNRHAPFNCSQYSKTDNGPAILYASKQLRHKALTVLFTRQFIEIYIRDRSPTLISKRPTCSVLLPYPALRSFVKKINVVVNLPRDPRHRCVFVFWKPPHS